MSVVKNTYELTYIVNAVISDDQIKDMVSRVSSYISESGGEIIEVEEWGTRRLAFPIQKKRNGYYVNMYFRASGALIARLERALEIDDNILRYLTLRMDAKMIRHFENRKSKAPEHESDGKEERSSRGSRSRTSESAPARKRAVKPVEVVHEAETTHDADASAEAEAQESATAELDAVQADDHAGGDEKEQA